MSISKLYNITIDSEIDKIVNNNPELKDAKDKIRELLDYVDPVVYWIDMNIKKIDDAKMILEKNEKKLIIDSAYVSEGLKNCHKATLIAATIGKKLPEHSKESYEKGNLWEGTIANIFGSEGVEMLVEKFHNYLMKTNRLKGIYSSPRFSPGYGDWDLKDQGKIINIMDTSPEIIIHDSYMLEPVKSITALIGWSYNPQEMKYPKGIKKKGFCEGKLTCENCRTWACKKK